MEAAVALDFFEGNIATIIKLKPNIVIPYKRHIAKIKSRLLCTKILREEAKTRIVDMPNTVVKRKINQDKK